MCLSLPVAEELPLGEELDFSPSRRPGRISLRGANVLVRPVNSATDAPSLYAISHEPDGDPTIWTYLPDGPYESQAHMTRALQWAESSEDPLYFALVPFPAVGALGLASYLRITPEFGAIEIGHIWFGPSLRRTRAASEVIYLLARHAFDELGYRRLEWKCNALNEASRRAAGRFGFSFEGIFRKHQVVKGRNRDTSWYAITDEQWPALRGAYEIWLAPENFDEQGRQRTSLSALIASARG
jgi:RimJ/RimL family protein N-acetyltransferase